MTNAVVGMVTCPSRTEARKVASAILKKKLAACVNIIGGLESHYWWRGKLETAREGLLLIKTTRARVSGVASAVKAAHSYEVPEGNFFPGVAGERNYLKWLRSSIAKVAVALLVLGFAGTARGDRIDDLVKQLGSTNDEERADAADTLSRIGGARVEKQFREMLASSSPEKRQVAVTGLLQMRDAAENLERASPLLEAGGSIARCSRVTA